MSLRRSPAALGVLHRFYKVDVVVFCEGGAPIAVADAVAGKGTEDTHDVLYWSFIVAHLNVGRRFHFKSVGSKSTLKSISSDVQSQGISTITICLDQDYDWFTGGKLAHHRLAYTHGYSWENDVVQPEVLRHLFHAFVGVGDKQTNAVNAMLAQVTKYSASVIRWCEIDMALTNMGKAGVFDRRKPLSCTDLDATPPCLRPASLKKRLTDLGYVRGPRKIALVAAQESLRVCFGKAVGHYMFHLFLHFVKSVSPGLKITYDSFMRLAIQNTVARFSAGSLPTLQTHFANQKSAF